MIFFVDEIHIFFQAFPRSQYFQITLKLMISRGWLQVPTVKFQWCNFSKSSFYSSLVFGHDSLRFLIAKLRFCNRWLDWCSFFCCKIQVPCFVFLGFWSQKKRWVILVTLRKNPKRPYNWSQKSEVFVSRGTSEQQHVSGMSMVTFQKWVYLQWVYLQWVYLQHNHGSQNGCISNHSYLSNIAIFHWTRIMGGRVFGWCPNRNLFERRWICVSPKNPSGYELKGYTHLNLWIWTSGLWIMGKSSSLPILLMLVPLMQ